MIRNICYANARDYMAFPTGPVESKPAKQTASNNGEPAAHRRAAEKLPS